VCQRLVNQGRVNDASQGAVSFGQGAHGQLALLGFDLVFYRIDSLSLPFGIIFSIAAFLACLYAWHVDDLVQQVATLGYAGSALGGVFAGDLITLFIWWEVTAVTSVFLIFARRTPGAMATGMRYLIIQVLSWLIFIAFGIKCAFPLMHNWLQDAYPAATVTGTVVLSAFTTKMAVYALARGYAGTEYLVYIGAIMTLFPIFFAEIENDLRRVLAYSLNNQLGFMVVGVGIGTELAINGTVAHAFSHILYKSLLFMSVGAVLYRTGTSKASELGGLYRTMPVTMVCCVIGAMSISAFPLFSGFISKSLILDAASKNSYYVVWFALVVASVHMRLAMMITAFLCVFIGVFPGTLYSLLPYAVNYEPYTMSHVLAQMQLLCFALLAFVYLMSVGLHPPELRAVNVDTDWIYRRGIPSILPAVVAGIVITNSRIRSWALAILAKGRAVVVRYASPTGPLADGWGVNAMVATVVVLMFALLMFNLL